MPAGAEEGALEPVASQPIVRVPGPVLKTRVSAACIPDERS